MSTWQMLATTWDLEPSVLAGCAGLLATYLWAARVTHARPGQVVMFAGGVACLLLALVSPIDVLGDEYLFSAHMLQHLLLVLVVPPMLLLGLPGEVGTRGVQELHVGVHELLGHLLGVLLLLLDLLGLGHRVGGVYRSEEGQVGQQAARDDTPFANAFRYRDWVIDAFNTDMPFDVKRVSAAALSSRPSSR